MLRMIRDRERDGAITNTQIEWTKEDSIQYAATRNAFNGSFGSVTYITRSSARSSAKEERSESASQLTRAQAEILSLPECKNGRRERINRSSRIIQSSRKRVMCIHGIRKSPAAGERRNSAAETHHIDEVGFEPNSVPHTSTNRSRLARGIASFSVLQKEIRVALKQSPHELGI